MDKLISVIMSTYNDGEYLKEALQSILWQTYKNIEIILIDDCSTDDTEKIVGSIDDERIHYYKNDVRCGLTKNLNKALDMATGQYIARMDADDISFPTRFEKQMSYLEGNDYSLIGAGIQEFGQRSNAWIPSSDSEELKVNLLFNTALPHPTFFFKREIVDKGFRYDEQFRYAQDYDFLFRVSQKYKISCAPEVLLNYRVHKKQVTLGKNTDQRACAESIRKKNLESLGISLSESEWKAFNHACYLGAHFDFQRIDDLINTDKVIIKLTQRLNELAIYNTDMIDEIFTIWFSHQVCLLDLAGREQYIESHKHERVRRALGRAIWNFAYLDKNKVDWIEKNEE